jgi:hypothetical protein
VTGCPASPKRFSRRRGTTGEPSFHEQEGRLLLLCRCCLHVFACGPIARMMKSATSSLGSPTDREPTGAVKHPHPFKCHKERASGDWIVVRRYWQKSRGMCHCGQEVPRLAPACQLHGSGGSRDRTARRTTMFDTGAAGPRPHTPIRIRPSSTRPSWRVQSGARSTMARSRSIPQARTSPSCPATITAPAKTPAPPSPRASWPSSSWTLPRPICSSTTHTEGAREWTGSPWARARSRCRPRPSLPPGPYRRRSREKTRRFPDA